MASTLEGMALTEAHDVAQAANTARALQASTLAFRGLLDPANIDAGVDAYTATASAVMNDFRTRSGALAGNYYQALRSLEATTSTPFVRLPGASPLDATQAATSLLVTGPVTFKAARAAGLSADDAYARALKSTLGAVGRHVQNGGREVVQRAVSADAAAKGWARISGGAPCYFCAMLISRGPVYRAETSTFRTHDHCRCRAEPVFQGSGWTPQAVEYRRIWDQATRGTRGPKEAQAAFRRALAKSGPRVQQVAKATPKGAVAKVLPAPKVSPGWEHLGTGYLREELVDLADGTVVRMPACSIHGIDVPASRGLVRGGRIVTVEDDLAERLGGFDKAAREAHDLFDDALPSALAEGGPSHVHIGRGAGKNALADASDYTVVIHGDDFLPFYEGSLAKGVSTIDHETAHVLSWHLAKKTKDAATAARRQYAEAAADAVKASALRSVKSKFRGLLEDGTLSLADLERALDEAAEWADLADVLAEHGTDGLRYLRFAGDVERRVRGFLADTNPAALVNLDEGLGAAAETRVAQAAAKALEGADDVSAYAHRGASPGSAWTEAAEADYRLQRERRFDAVQNLRWERATSTWKDGKRSINFASTSERGVTSYGATKPGEDWAEFLSMLRHQERHGSIGTDARGNPITLAEAFPHRYAYWTRLLEVLEAAS